MKDNRGLTLVELLITVTILALVIAGAATFMLAGSKSFAKGSADSNVQGEAELAVNQIEDLIIDVNGGVDFTDDSTASTLTMYHVEADNSGVAVNKKRTVKWDKSDNNIYSGEWTVDKDGSGVYVETSTVYANQLLAENVTDFNVDLSDKYTETAKDGTDIEIVRSVVIRVDCLDGTGRATYATTPTITLRNRLMISSNPDEIFQQTPTPDDSLLLYISSTGMEGAVPVRDRVTTVERGNAYNIFVMVNAGTNVNSLCDFTVEGETSGALSTITPEGVHISLDVNDAEPNDYLKITATYKTNSAKKVIGWVRVIGGNSKSLLGVKIIPAGNVPNSNNPFSELFNSAYTHDKLTDEDIATFKYTWEVIDASRFEPFANDKNSISLYLIKEPENYDQVVEIKLTLYCASTNQTVSDRILYRTPSQGTTKGDSLVERGKRDDENAGYHGDNWYGFSGGPWIDQGSITYEAYFCDIYGERISAYDPLLDQLEIKVGDGSYWFTFKENLPPENEYYIKIIVKYHVYTENWDHTITEADWQYSRIHYIPAVSLWGGTIHLSPNEWEFEFTYDIIGYYELEWSSARAPYVYEVVELNCDLPEGYTVTPEIGGTQARTETMIRAQCKLNMACEKGENWFWEHQNEIKPKSMKIKVYLKDHPNIYTYIDVLFDKE